MTHLFVFVCPSCKTEDSIRKSLCIKCGEKFSITPEQINTSQNIWPLPVFMNWMKENLEIEQDKSILRERWNYLPLDDIPGVIRISRAAILRQGTKRISFAGYRNLFQRFIVCLQPIASGYVVISSQTFYFIEAGQRFEFPVADITCVTTNSNYFEFKIKGKPVYQVQFLEESPLKYEFIFQKLLDRHYTLSGRQVLEYQPALRFEYPSLPRPVLKIEPEQPVKFNLPEFIVSRFLLFNMKVLFRLFIRVTVYNRHLLPHEYTYISLSNHQNIFDPFIILAFLRKGIAFLTKSTSFCHRWEYGVLRLGRTIPTTRFQTDPEVIYTVMTFLRKGLQVGIFPEGERCWDGRLQPFKISVIRLIMQLRIPVVPIILHNSFNFFPRWARIPARTNVDLEVCPPFCLVPDIFSLEELKDFVENHFRNALEQDLY